MDEMQLLDKRIGYFLVTVEEGSFSAAARKLFLTQSALSQQIALLEQELDVRLFDRSGYRPVLTEKGKHFYEGCCHLRSHSRTLLAELHSLSRLRLRVGITGAYENREAMELINRYRREHPEIKVSYVKGDFVSTRESLMNGALDIAFGIESEFLNQKGLQYETLFSFQMCVACSFDHAFARKQYLEPSELKGEPMIVLSRKNGRNLYRDFMEACRKDGFHPVIRREADSLDEQLFQISIGEGIGITAAEVVRPNEVKLVPLHHTHHKSEYAVAYRTDALEAPAREFLETVRSFFSQRQEATELH